MKPIKAAKDFAIDINLMGEMLQWWATGKNLKRHLPSETGGKGSIWAREQRKKGAGWELNTDSCISNHGQRLQHDKISRGIHSVTYCEAFLMYWFGSLWVFFFLWTVENWLPYNLWTHLSHIFSQLRGGEKAIFTVVQVLSVAAEQVWNKSPRCPKGVHRPLRTPGCLCNVSPWLLLASQPWWHSYTTSHKLGK